MKMARQTATQVAINDVVGERPNEAVDAVSANAQKPDAPSSRRIENCVGVLSSN